MAIVLGFETSCDETAVSVVEVGAKAPRIIVERVASQADLHAAYGGVVPELAAREHLKTLPLILDQVLSHSAECATLDAVAVTSGPGLKGCLLMGVGFARAYALQRHLPLLCVNHIEGHLHAARLAAADCRYPYLALVVSGGHTELIHVRALGDYECVARTIDDAAGEAFDKSASLLGLPYPGGPNLARLADSIAPENARAYNFQLPKVMREAEGFSFSGLKTAIALLVKREGRRLLEETERRAALAFVVQEAIVEALIFKLKGALRASRLSRVVVTGGVAANRFLRERVSELPEAQVYFPDFRHCQDNASMIALVGGERFLAGETSGFDAPVSARWAVESCGVPRSRIEAYV